MQILTKIFLQTFAVSKIISIFAPRLRDNASEKKEVWVSG